MDHQTEERISQIRGHLLAWYDKNRRNLPWRGTQDPYAIWVSEVMLQQTRTETVIRYYDSFLEKFPDIRTLAQADEQDVLKAWEGLGYYRRARALHAGCQEVLHKYGKMPGSYEQLLGIHGIGTYTAGAIASIAYQIPVPAVDGNALRVLTRLNRYTDEVDGAQGRRTMQSTGQMFVDPERPGDFNQAVMDLGSGICHKGKPSCEKCPLQNVCFSAFQDIADSLPVHRAKREATVETWNVLLAVDGRTGEIAVRQRKEEMLKGLWVFPMTQAEPEGKMLGRARHVFTHRIWEMTIYQADKSEVEQQWNDLRWINAEELKNLPFPSAMRVPLSLAGKVMES